MRQGELGEVTEQVRPLLIEAARVKGVKGGGGEFGQGPPARPGLLGAQLGAQERPAVGALAGPDPAGGGLGLPAGLGGQRVELDQADLDQAAGVPRGQAGDAVLDAPVELLDQLRQ